MNSSVQEEASELRGLIQKFIEDRLAPKLEIIEKKIASEDDSGKRKDLEDKKEKLLRDYQPETWLANAAKRATQIKMVTHAIKYSHPDARGTSIYASYPYHMNQQTAFIGSHTVNDIANSDVVGNAAALDVFKFLKLEHRGRTILNRVRERDSKLVDALCNDSKMSNSWIGNFSQITEGDPEKSSHTYARQLFFPLPDNGYNILSPLFPTSLVHYVYQRLSEERFAESVKEARQARREGKPCEQGYHEYPNLAIQIFGGSKPQNISQLNSERHGENWLLPSCPPTWRSERIRPPLRTTSVFRRWFGARPNVRELVKALADFLARARNYTNINIRHAREEMVDILVDELFQFAGELAELPPGWSAGAECRLVEAEALWLDPGRAKDDKVFAARHAQSDWKDEVASRFGNWLNAQLRSRKSLPLGDAESSEWRDVVEERLANIKMEIGHD